MEAGAPAAYLLLAAIVIWLVAWAVQGASGIPDDAVVIVAILVLNAVLGYAQEVRAENAVAADARVLSATNLMISEASLTGESELTVFLGVVLAGVLGLAAAGAVALATLASLDLYLPGGLLGGPVGGSGSLDSARTVGFTVLVLAQLFNAFNARSESASAFHRLFTNRWLWGAVLVSAALQVAVVRLPALNAAFSTTPLSWGQWLVCTAMASTVLWVSEARKALLRVKSSPLRGLNAR